jgi:DNA adenine methylase
MAYLGGKATGANHIIKILNHPMFKDMPYIEPFCGYCHVLRRIKDKSSYVASDSNDLLIVLLKHIQKSKEHPTISATEYQTLRADPSIDYLAAAYAAFTYSYNGKYFAGYVGDKTRNYPAERKRYYNRLHDNPIFQNTSIFHRSYDHYSPTNTKGSLIYCDPPYEDTAAYRNSFNSATFWNWVREMSTAGNIVIVSEYSAPKDFVCLASHGKRETVSGKGRTLKRQEAVFVHESVASLMQTIMTDISKQYPCKRSTNSRTRKSTRSR